VGTILPIKELCAIAHQRGILFHTDVVRAIGQTMVDVVDLEVDMGRTEEQAHCAVRFSMSHHTTE